MFSQHPNIFQINFSVLPKSKRYLINNDVYISQRELRKKNQDVKSVGTTERFFKKSLGLKGIKIHKIIVLFLELRVSFSSNFASLFSVMGDNSSVLFQLKLCMIQTKGAPQKAKFQTFDCSREISPNLYFNSLLLLKVYKILAKKVQRSYVS